MGRKKKDEKDLLPSGREQPYEPLDGKQGDPLPQLIHALKMSEPKKEGGTTDERATDKH